MRGRRWTTVAIVVLLVTQAVYWPWSRWITSPLFAIPVTLDRAQSIERAVSIPVAEPYRLSLRFPRGVADGQLPGAPAAIPLGVDPAAARMPVRWRLSRPDGSRVASDETTAALRASSWNSDTSG